MSSAITTVRQPNGTAYRWTLICEGASSQYWRNAEGDTLRLFFEQAPRFKPFIGKVVRLPVYAEDLEECLKENATFLHKEGLL